MRTFLRWCRFNTVGAMGMAVQLAALAVLNRYAGGHYLYATAAAIEITLLHNFAWHRRYTWRDRYSASAAAQFARFHLSNGLVSMVGNLALMRLLVEEARMPVLAANSVAVLCCSVANFFLGDRWIFARPATARGSGDETTCAGEVWNCTVEDSVDCPHGARGGFHPFF